MDFLNNINVGAYSGKTRKGNRRWRGKGKINFERRTFISVAIFHK